MRGALIAALVLTTLSAGSVAQTPARIVENPSFTYADLVSLVERSDVVADVEAASAVRLKGADAANVPAGSQRFYIEGKVLGLLGGKKGVPGQISWLADVATGPTNRSPKLKKARLLVFANTIDGRQGEIRLAAPYGQLWWSPDIDARARGILRELAAADAPPVITKVGNAFFVPGSLPGESETQIFLRTEDGRPVSLAILRRPGETPRWAVALGELVDESAAPPRPDSLLWYRLACSLPPELPPESTTDLQAEAAEAARIDYRVIIEGLGPCARNFPLK